MHLEDHLGDILRKGREAKGIAAAVAAQTAGLTEPAYQALEETGQYSGQLPFPALGAALGLDGAKLERIANGWLPATPDLSMWCEFRQITTRASGMEVQ